MAAQYLSTSRLANVIQLITLGRQTGILRVIRGHGPSREMGQIQFVDGQPTAALLGSLTGGAAMNVISNWGDSYYSFDEAALADDGHLEPHEGVPLAPALGARPSPASGSWPTPTTNPAWGGPQSGGLTGGPSATSWPAYGYQTPPPPQPRPAAMPAPAPPPPSSIPSPVPSMPPSPPSIPPMTSSPSYPFAGRGSTGGLPGELAGFGGSQPGMGGSPPSGPHPATPAVAIGAPPAIPRRTARADLNEPLPLDRRERMILLLVDGRRRVDDLARLTRRSEEEVQAVLANLRMLGLVE
jgi:hypothetical protein